MPWPKGRPNNELKKWTKEQEDYVDANYDGNGSTLSNVLPFSASAIRNKAKRLGTKNTKHFHNVVKTEMPNLSQYELGYIAGFVDGEGSITHSSTASSTVQHRIQIGNSDAEVISWIHITLRVGVIRVNKARKLQHLDSYVLNIERQGDVWGFLEMIYPYLKTKRSKSLLVLRELEQRHIKPNSLMISGG
jgi:hypothetical protein